METQSDGTGADFGPLLRQLREKSGLTVAEVSRRTRIPAETLENLESERLERLPPHTYVRGFIRAFTQAVDDTATESLARYEKAAAAAKSKAEAGSESPTGSRLGAGRRRRVIVALVIAFALTVAVVVLWRA